MEQNANKYINVSYKLYDITNGEPRLLEETTPDHPFIFISGMGVVLPKFEENLINMAQGETFEFVLTPEEAYGERTEKHIVNVARETFCQNGHFDHDNVFVGAEIPLQNEDGNRFTGKVMEIADDNVKIDLNHPLAGLTLRFTGEILETREATIEEMTRLAKLISGECGCGCGHGEEGCSCGHHHEHGEEGCCGHHHDHGDEGCSCGGHGHHDGCCHHHDEEGKAN